MTDRYGRGSTASLTAYFRVGGSGALTDADPVSVDILDPDGVVIVSDDDPTSHPSTGTYIYSYVIAEDAQLGVWSARWSGVINGLPVTGEDPFEVVAAGGVSFSEDTFATVDELATFLQTSIAEDDDRALLALRSATGLIQREAKHHIFYVEDDVKTIDGTLGSKLVLPEPPVFAVSAINEGEYEVDVDGVAFTRRGALTREGFWSGAEVTVTYTHGFEMIPADIKALCLEVAGRMYSSEVGLDSEQIGSYSYTTSSDASASGVELTDAGERICRAFWPVIA